MSTVATSYAILGRGPFRLRWTGGKTRAHDLRRRIALLVVLGYLPMAVASFLRHFETGAWPMFLREISPHVRVLVALPLFLFGEDAIEARAAGVGKYLLRSGLVPPRRVEHLHSIIARTVRIRDSLFAEIVLLALAFVSVVAFPAPARAIDATVAWSLQPAALLARFLIFRLLWHWAVWALYLHRVVRLPLACHVSHPDRAGGLSPLAGPSTAFGFVIMAVGSSVSAEWADRMRFEGFEPSGQASALLAFAVLAFIVDLAPLAVLIGPLRRLRWRDTQSMAALATRYSAAFEKRWLTASGEEALGASAIQSLNDLGASFERVQGIRVVLAPRSLVTMILFSIVAPFAPLFVAEMGAPKLLAELAKALL